METSGDKPNWDTCPFYNTPHNQAVLTEYMDNIGIAPKVFRPPGASSWRTIKLGVWFEYVMGRKY